MSILQGPLTRKLSAFVALGAADLETLSQFHRRRRSFLSGHEMIHEGQKSQSAFILAEGWACSYKMLPDGERQIVDFQIPGDFLGLRSVLLRTTDHSVEAITRIEASEVLASDMLDGFARAPRLATAVLWAASRDEAMVVEHLVSIGRRSAEERMVHFLLELGARLELVGLGDRAGFDCPLTQYHLADVLGLSAVHVNRVLRHLREEGLLTFQKGHVSFDDLLRLRGSGRVRHGLSGSGRAAAALIPPSARGGVSGDTSPCAAARTAPASLTASLPRGCCGTGDFESMDAACAGSERIGEAPCRTGKDPVAWQRSFAVTHYKHATAEYGAVTMTIPGLLAADTDAGWCRRTILPALPGATNATDGRGKFPRPVRWQSSLIAISWSA